MFNIFPGFKSSWPLKTCKICFYESIFFKSILLYVKTILHTRKMLIWKINFNFDYIEVNLLNLKILFLFNFTKYYFLKSSLNPIILGENVGKKLAS